MMKRFFCGLATFLLSVPAFAAPPRLTDIQAAMPGIDIFAECGTYVAGGEPRPVWGWQDINGATYFAINGEAYPMFAAQNTTSLLDFRGEDYRVVVLPYDGRLRGYDFERQAAIVVENVVTGEKSAEYGIYFSIC